MNVQPSARFLSRFGWRVCAGSELCEPILTGDDAAGEDGEPGIRRANPTPTSDLRTHPNRR